MKQIFKYSSKHYKIKYEVWEDVLIEIWWKNCFLMSAVSQNLKEWKEDTETALSLLKEKQPKRWLNKLFKEIELPFGENEASD